MRIGTISIGWDELNSDSFSGWLLNATTAFAVFFIVQFLMIAVLRISYPFDLEWMEGGMVDHILRVIDGRQLYVPPSLEFIPYIYPPLYYWVSAPFTWLFGPTATGARLVSLLATCGTMIVIATQVRSFTKSRRWAVVGAGIYAACFELGGGWYDLARVDSLYVFLLLLAVHLLMRQSSTKGAVAAGLVAALCFLTKQTAAVTLAPVFLVAFAFDHRRIPLAALTAILVGGGIMLEINQTSAGWLRFYLFDLPATHDLHYRLASRLFSDQLIPELPLGFVAIVTLIAAATMAPRMKSRLLWGAFAIGVIGSCSMSYTHLGSYLNVLIPIYAVAAVAIPVCSARAMSFAGSQPSRALSKMSLLIPLLVVGQLTMLLYPPGRHLPSKADAEAGRQLLNKIAKVEGDVIVPHFANLTARAGKSHWLHQMALNDINKSQYTSLAAMLERDIRQCITERRFSGIAIGRYHDGWIDKAFYREGGRLFGDTGVFWPREGFHLRPEFLFIPDDHTSTTSDQVSQLVTPKSFSSTSAASTKSESLVIRKRVRSCSM